MADTNRILSESLDFIAETFNHNKFPDTKTITSWDYIVEIKITKKHDGIGNMEEWHKNCPHCGQSISKRMVPMWKEMVSGLIKAFEYCKKNGVHEFEFTAIKHLFTQLEYSRFNYLVRFWLAYKIQRGTYGLPMKRESEWLPPRWSGGC